MTDIYTAPFMLRMFKPTRGILPWLCCRYDPGAFLPAQARGLSVKVQCPSVLVWKGSVSAAARPGWHT